MENGPNIKNGDFFYSYVSLYQAGYFSMGPQWMPSQTWDGKHGNAMATLVEGLPCSINETTTSNVKPGFRFTLVGGFKHFWNFP